MEITIDVKKIYGEQAALSELAAYELKVLELAGEGNAVELTGPGPVWLYLRLAHVLHGRVTQLSYNIPGCGPVLVFSHRCR